MCSKNNIPSFYVFKAAKNKEPINNNYKILCVFCVYIRFIWVQVHTGPHVSER